MSSAPSTYDVDLDAAWTANGHCTAGYLAAVVARATLEDQRAPFPAVTSVHARYLRVTASAPVGHSPDVPAQDDRLPVAQPGTGLRPAGVLPQYADPAGLGRLGGEPSGRGLAQGWVEPAVDADLDTLTLVAAADSLPTATFDRGLQGWAATLDLTGTCWARRARSAAGAARGARHRRRPGLPLVGHLGLGRVARGHRRPALPATGLTPHSPRAAHASAASSSSSCGSRCPPSNHMSEASGSRSASHRA